MRRILFLVLMFSTAVAWAEEYYWYHSLSPDIKFPSAIAAAEYVVSNRTSSNPDWSNPRLGNTEFIQNGTRLSFCTRWDLSGGGVHNSCWDQVRRGGDSCPEGTEYNPATGNCDEPEPDECADKEGQSQLLRKTGKAPDAFMWISSGGEFYITETDVCHQGCKVSGVESKCNVKTSGDYNCRASGVFTGDKCTASTGPGGDSIEPSFDGSDDLELPPPQKDEEYIPCIYEVHPDGSKGCVSNTKIEKEGMSCGIANGQMVCSHSTPSSSDLTITTTVTEKTNADGSTEITQTDRADYVTCVGAKCTSGTSTNTSTTNKDGNGNTTSVTGSCTGPLCADKNTNPDGNGDGLGDCVGPDCGLGNAEFADFGEDVGSFGDSLEGFYQRIGESELIGSLSGIAGSIPGGSCSIPTVQTMIGVLDFNAFCTLAPTLLQLLHYVFMAGWAFAAIRVLFSA